MMMSRFDLGGCCLARYGTATPYFASKKDQIMSRYRPIAPKPVAQSAGGVVEAVVQQQPPSTLESTRIRSRSRKRSWEGGGTSSSPRGQKRAARCRPNGLQASQHQEQSRIERTPTPTNNSHSDTSEDGVSTLCEISDSAATATGSINFGTSLGYYSASSCTSFDCAFAAHNHNHKNKNKNEGLLEKDVAFMERAAASACPNVNLPERRSQALISCERVQHQHRHQQHQHQGGSALDQGPKKKDLVTLPLLPIAPYCSSTSGVMQSAFEEECQTLPELSLSNKMTVRIPCPVVDISLVEHLYSAASDPLLVTDDSYAQQVIWYNPAYKRLLSLSLSASELGIPKPLATLTLHNQPSTAILWGFPGLGLGLGQNRESPLPSKKGVGVIMPQPVRPVGSSVVVECITDTNLMQEGMGMGMGMEEVEEQLESKTSPCLISDSEKRVRWANSAYKQMVGQPQCSWLEREKVVRIQGRVVLVLNSALQLPQDIAAFSCRVKIKWSNAADTTSITVPCDVVRINANADSSFAWHFDIQAALCL